MKRSHRILVEVLTPPALAAVFECVVSMMTPPGKPDFSALWLLLPLSYVGGILPSVAYAAIMEFAFSSGLPVRSWWTVVLSTVLGHAAGWVVTLLFFSPENLLPVVYLTLVIVGTIVGLILGMLIRVLPPVNSAPQNA